MRENRSWLDCVFVRGAVGQSFVRCSCCTMVHASTLLCGGCRCERVLRIDLVMNKISTSLVAKGLQNCLLALALEAYMPIRLSHMPYYVVLDLCTKPNP